MHHTQHQTNHDAVPERPALLPNAASLRPTHVTSHLPPIKSLQNPNHTSRSRSPFRRRKHDSRPSEHPTFSTNARKLLPSSNTLQTFLTVTQAPHLGHTHHFGSRDDGAAAPHHAHAHDSSPKWRVRKTPIFSGLLAPFSIMLEVPGLTSKWYAKIDQNGFVERFVDNPPILTVGLSISLGAAVVANAAIIFRFLEVLRPRQSIALAIAGFALHDLINVVALATFGGIYGPKHDGLSLSASYWMVCSSTITSTLVTISLVADYVRTKDFRHAGSGLTQLQKGLVLAGMALLLYLSLGSLIFVFVIKIDFITALYFSTATILTVGFGDVVPQSAGGKVLVILYAPIGIVLVAIVVSSARNTILETFQATLLARTKERRRRMAERRAAQKEHKRQDRALRRIMPRTSTFGPDASAEGKDCADDSNDFADALARMEKQAADHHPQNESPVGSGVTGSSVDTKTTSESTSHTTKHDQDSSVAAEKDPLAIAGDPALQREIKALQHELLVAQRRTEEEFRQFEEHSRHEAIMAARMKLALAASMTLAFWLLGAVAFRYAERWSYGGALWFCFIAMITIGYGDYHPSTQLGRGIFVIWGLMGVAVLTILLAVVQDAFGGIFHKLLTNSTSRLFDRAERRAQKRRLKKQQEPETATKAEDDMEATDTRQAGSSSVRKLHLAQRKSEGDVPQRKYHTDAAERKGKSMEARVERSARAASPEPVEMEGLEPPLKLVIPSFLLEQVDSTGDGLWSTHIQLPRNAAARVEDTLVSTPQKLAFAALQTFQHSVRVLRLHEPMIVQAMNDVPALRHYYTSRQRAQPTHADESQDGSATELDAETALQNLHASLQQTANPEYDKVAQLVVANVEFEHHLRVLLDGFQGLKDRVEGFKQTQLERSRTMSMSEKPTIQAAQDSPQERTRTEA